MTLPQFYRYKQTISRGWFKYINYYNAEMSDIFLSSSLAAFVVIQLN